MSVMGSSTAGESSIEPLEGSDCDFVTAAWPPLRIPAKCTLSMNVILSLCHVALCAGT